LRACAQHRRVGLAGPPPPAEAARISLSPSLSLSLHHVHGRGFSASCCPQGAAYPARGGDARRGAPRTGAHGGEAGELPAGACPPPLPAAVPAPPLLGSGAVRAWLLRRRRCHAGIPSPRGFGYLRICGFATDLTGRTAQCHTVAGMASPGGLAKQCRDMIPRRCQWAGVVGIRL
jgi:hypothetical protein